MQDGVAFTLRPAIYKQDALITRKLGFSYLWIDSMCIIQDYPLDWQRQASMMALVYGNSICNLASPFPPDCVDTRPRPTPTSYLPCILYPASDKIHGRYAAHSRNSYISRVLANRRMLATGPCRPELGSCRNTYYVLVPFSLVITT